MRFFIIIILCFSSLCLAQEKYRNDEFGFTMEIPPGWYASFRDDWPEKLKNNLEWLYLSKDPLLLMLNPLNTEIAKFPCIHIQGVRLKIKTTSEVISHLKRNGRNSSARAWAKDLLGKNFDQYHEVDVFSDYNSSKKLGISIITYEHKTNKDYFLVAIASFIGSQRRIEFNGFYKGDDPEEFKNVFTDVIDSFEFDADVAVKGGLRKTSELSGEQKFKKIWKWTGWLLTASIILGFAKMAYNRWR